MMICGQHYQQAMRFDLPVTNIFKFRWPSGNESNDVEEHLKQLAMDVEAQLDVLHPIGIAYPYFIPGDAPTGFIFLKGQTVSRTAYPRIAAALGITTSTFVLPDYRKYVPRGADDGQAVGGVLGSDSFILVPGQMPAHDHGSAGLIVSGDHYHNPGENQYLITQPTPQVHAIQAFNGGGGAGNVQVTFTRNEPMDNSSLDVTGRTDISGAGDPVTHVPRSRLVNFITRAA